LNNLGDLLLKQGDNAAARAYFDEALNIQKKAFGPEHPETALSLNNLGFLLYSQAEHVTARPYYEQALAIMKNVLGSDHPDTALSYGNLARTLRAQGQYAQAERIATAAAASFRAARLRISFGGLQRTTFAAKRSSLPLLAALLARNGKPSLAWQRLEENLA